MVSKLISLNKSRENMRKALGMDLSVSIEDTLEVYYLMAQFLDLGKIKEQQIPEDIKKRKKFLSQYKKQTSFIRTNENKIVDQNSTYHDQRKHVLKILHEFCIKNNFKLKIFPRSFKKDDWENENLYFQRMFKNIKLVLIKRNHKKQIYDCL